MDDQQTPTTDPVPPVEPPRKPRTVLPIPNQVTFGFAHRGQPRGRQSGLPAKCAPGENGTETWATARLTLDGVPEPGCTLTPEGNPGWDRRRRVVTAVARSADKMTWILTCTVQG